MNEWLQSIKASITCILNAWLELFMTLIMNPFYRCIPYNSFMFHLLAELSFFASASCTLLCYPSRWNH